MTILGSNLSSRNNPKNGQNNFISRVRIEPTICCQCANFDVNAVGETLLERTVYTMFFSCNSEELYEIGGGINYEVANKIVPALLDCRKPRSYALRVKQQ